MGMAASQARFLELTARKSNTEYQGQQINQQRTALGNESANIFQQLADMEVPTPPSVKDYTHLEYSFVTDKLSGSKETYKFSELISTPSGDEVSLKHGRTFYSPTSVLNAQLGATLARTTDDYESETGLTDQQKFRYKSYLNGSYGIKSQWTGIKLRDNATSNDSYVLKATTPCENLSSEILSMCSGDNANKAFSEYYLDENGNIKDDMPIYFYLDQNGARCFLNPSEMDVFNNDDQGLYAGSFDSVTNSDAYFIGVKKNGEMDAVNMGITFNTVDDLYNFVPPQTAEPNTSIHVCMKDANGNSSYSQYNFKYDAEGNLIGLVYDDENNSPKVNENGEKMDAAYYANKQARLDANMETSITTFTALASKPHEEYVKEQYKVISSTKTDVGRLDSITIAVPKEDGSGTEEVTVTLDCTQVQDEAAYDQAMLDYNFLKDQYEKKQQDLNAKTKVIQQQDKNLETRLKQLDTEQSALKTEMDAVKKVTDDNVDSTFKTFG